MKSLAALFLSVCPLFGQNVLVKPTGNPFQETIIRVFRAEPSSPVAEITGRCVHLAGVKRSDKDFYEDLSISCYVWRVRLSGGIALYTLRGYWHYHPEYTRRLPDNHPDKNVEGDAEGYTVFEGGKESEFITRYSIALTWAQDILDAQVDKTAVPRMAAAAVHLTGSIADLLPALSVKRNP